MGRGGAMQQKPVNGADPLNPPDAHVAQAYLDVLPGVQECAELVLDRRRLGWLQIIQGFSVALYLAVIGGALLLHLAPGVQGQPTALPLPGIAVFLLWTTLAQGLQERYGSRQPLRGRRRAWYWALMVAALLCFLPLGVLAFIPLRIAPVLLVLTVALALSAGLYAGGGLIHEGRADPPRPAPAHAAFDTSSRWWTALCGVCLAVCVAATGLAVVPGYGVPLASFSAMAVLLVQIVGQLTRRLPAVGEAWRAPQWVLLALAASATTATTLLAAVQASAAPTIGVVLGVAVLLLTLVVCLLPEPDHG